MSKMQYASCRQTGISMSSKQKNMTHFLLAEERMLFCSQDAMSFLPPQNLEVRM